MTSLASTAKMLRGSELQSLFEDGAYAALLFSGKITVEASNALDRITHFYGMVPSRDGGNIPGITQLRDMLYHLAQDKLTLNGLAIIAPHSHWHGRQPVIYTYHPTLNIYRIGEQKIRKDSYYKPVTFIFSDYGALPYEWADESVPIDPAAWEECLQLIQLLNATLNDTTLPLGIAIDFRFRYSLYGEAEPSMEKSEPTDDPALTGLSTITHQTTHYIPTGDEVMDQVSWHALSDLLDGFNEEEIALLNKFRSFLNQAKTPEEQEKMIRQLDDEIS
ncbi:hypothetical protein [Chitinophaga sp. RAB17]|uniref:hypothetical protein n=1 Tax=Chitinophaga sp. RAB17 TaxID=3233049 RepID=UPI003F8F663D